MGTADHGDILMSSIFRDFGSIPCGQRRLRDVDENCEKPTKTAEGPSAQSKETVCGLLRGAGASRQQEHGQVWEAARACAQYDRGAQCDRSIHFIEKKNKPEMAFRE